MKSRRGALAKLLVAGCLFLALAVLLTQSDRLWRFDLTENELYTLSAGTRNVLQGMQKDVHLTLYLSERATKEIPALNTYAARVTELLEEYVAVSDGRLSLDIVDPEPFSQAEIRASNAGLESISVGAGDQQIYFGLVGESATGEQRAIEFFDVKQATRLEYDLTKLVHSLQHPEPAVVGILSGLPIQGSIDFRTGTRQPPWLVLQQVQDLFEVRWLSGLDPDRVRELDVLLLIHPVGLSPETRFAIDQYVLGGGKLIAFLDPYSEAAGRLSSGTPIARRSDLPALLRAWGVNLNREFIGDNGNALVVTGGARRNPVRHIGLLGLTSKDFANNQMILADLSSITLSTTGYFSFLDDSPVKPSPLLRSSWRSMPIPTTRLGQIQSPDALLEGFEPTGERYVLATYLTGRATSAFPGGVPAPDISPVPTLEDVGLGELKPPPKPVPTMHYSGDINVLLFADTDMLSDRLWVQVEDFLGHRMATPWADNGSLLINALDRYSGTEDLISIRSRGQFSRPFTRLEAMRRDAESRLLSKQQALRRQLQETEEQVLALEKGNASEETLSVSSRRQSFVAFQKEKLAIRQALREVQHQLNSDIESLGMRLRMLNIVVMPLVSTILLALIYCIYRQRQRYR